MAYNTGNPVGDRGSRDPRDLIDNSESFDIRATSRDVRSTPDRLGVSRKTWYGMERDFAEFLAASGFEPVHLVYQDGVALQVDRPTQLIDYSGSVYRVKMPASFPVMLSGSWPADSSILVAFNDQTLRQELADYASPSAGADLVKLADPDGDPIGVGEELRRLDAEFSVSAKSSFDGIVYAGPLTIQARHKLRITGDSADAEYNYSALQEIFSGLPQGASVEFPTRGDIRCDPGLIIDTPGISLIGHSMGYGSCRLRFHPVAGREFAIGIRSSGFMCSDMMFFGDGVASTTQGTFDLFDFGPALDKNCDAQVYRGGGVFFRDIAAVKNNHARNIRFDSFNFSNSRRAFSYELPGAYTAGDSNLGYEFYNCRYHTMLLDPANNTDSIFYFNPLSNVSHVVIDGGLIDSSGNLLRGFAGGLDARNLSMRNSAGNIMDFDATGTSINGDRTDVSLTDIKLYRTNSSVNNRAIVKAAGPMQLHVDGLYAVGGGGHGMDIGCRFTELNNVRLQDVGQHQDDTYSGFYIRPTAQAVVFGGGNVYRQDRIITRTNKAKFGVENYGDATAFESKVFIDNLTGKEFYNDPTKQFYGYAPVGYPGLMCESYGAGAPATGAWKDGDLVINRSPAAAVGGKVVSHWKYLGGTWVAFTAV